MTAGEARTLAVADHLGPVRQTELAAALSIEPMSLVAHLDRLEAAGLVERRPDPADRRSKRVHLTTKARPVLRRIMRVLTQARQEAMDDFSAAEAEQFRQYLQRLCRNLGAGGGA
nr:MarR family transcriptional regulator [Xanthomonadaceae bacterium]